MLNNPDAYTEAGRKSAEARNQRDEARAQHWAQHFRRMRGSEQDAARLEAYRLYNEAYMTTRNNSNPHGPP